MAYSVPRSDGIRLVTVETGSVNSSPPLTVGLVGRNTIDYGLTVATTQLQILENFSNISSPVNPVPGQLWYNSTDKRLNVNIGTTDGEDTWSTLVSTVNGNDLGSPLNPFDALYVKSIWGADVGSTGVMNGNWTLGPSSSFRATYADFAERFSADKSYEPGTVVKIGGEKEITETTFMHDEDVLGVISTNPAFLLNETSGPDETHPPVALAGRIPVKIKGPIRKGQRLVSSEIPGVAQVSHDNDHPFSVIGRALEDSNIEDVSLVMVIVGAK